jgi:gamma-glutamylputrescine oxidase
MISIWEKEAFFAPQDVVIVGSGFAGLWSAFFLKKKYPKLQLTLLDRGRIPAGASTRNAGFACFGSVSELMYDIQTMGLDKTLALVAMRHKGLERIQKYFDETAIDFEMSGGYELFDHAANAVTANLDENIAYLNSLLREITGSKNTYKSAPGKIEKFGFAGVQHLVKNNFEGTLHSGKLVRALQHRVQSMGVAVYQGVSVKSFREDGSGIAVIAEDLPPFPTRQVLVCTNAFARELLPRASVVPARGQVLLTSPIEGLPWKGSFHFDEGFYYFRNLGNRVLLGGARNKDMENEETFSMTTSGLIQAELERFLSEVVLPNHKDRYAIEMRWSGIMGMGADKMPVVQEVQPNIFCLVGLGGMGVALAPVAGQMAAEMLG